jgi:ERCC4-related helicase
VKLRPYQDAAIAALHAHLQSSTGYPLVDMATGTGKSLVIAAAVQQLAQQHPNARFLILAPRLELIEQDIAAIENVARCAGRYCLRRARPPRLGCADRRRHRQQRLPQRRKARPA